jgi:hypothetical protein
MSVAGRSAKQSVPTKLALVIHLHHQSLVFELGCIATRELYPVLWLLVKAVLPIRIAAITLTLGRPGCRYHRGLVVGIALGNVHDRRLRMKDVGLVSKGVWVKRVGERGWVKGVG